MNLSTVARLPFVVLLMSACSMSPIAQPTPSASAPATPAATPSSPTQPTATPGQTFTPEPSGTPEPTAKASEPNTPRPYFDPPEGSKPPKASLSSGTVSVEASPIGYCWDNECVDGPNPPKDQLPELELNDSDLEMEFEVADDVRFARWGAEYFKRSDDTAATLGGGGFSYDPDVTPATPWVEMSRATFPAPPPGDWVVNVYLELVHGDLSYAWHVIVP